MSCNNENYTLTFDEKVRGWTSFHSFFPDFMVGMNNKFFSFNGGNLHIHHSDNVVRNSYYGAVSPSKLSVMINDKPSDIKELQAVSLEGNYSWDSLISAYVDNVDNAIISSIDEVEFVQKEGIWYAYARRNEDSQHLDSKSTYGIGRVQTQTGATLTIAGGSDLLCVGDSLVNGDTLTSLGVITSITQGTGNVIVTLAAAPLVPLNTFVVGMKNSRIEGGNLRGYTMRFDLEITQPDKVELFAVNAEVMKSFS